jgi:hypothetical protein
MVLAPHSLRSTAHAHSQWLDIISKAAHKYPRQCRTVKDFPMKYSKATNRKSSSAFIERLASRNNSTRARDAAKK